MFYQYKLQGDVMCIGSGSFDLVYLHHVHIIMSIINQTNRHYSTNICKENTDMQCVVTEVKIIGKILLYILKSFLMFV